MSSQPPEPPGGAEETPPTKWPRWRILMLAGAFVLLGAAILDAAVDGLPRWLYVVIFSVGYVLLAYGFFTAMSARREGSTKR